MPIDPLLLKMQMPLPARAFIRNGKFGGFVLADELTNDHHEDSVWEVELTFRRKLSTGAALHGRRLDEIMTSDVLDHPELLAPPLSIKTATSTQDILRVSVAAKVDPRTVKRRLRGDVLRSLAIQQRIDDALRELGFQAAPQRRL